MPALQQRPAPGFARVGMCMRIIVLSGPTAPQAGFLAISPCRSSAIDELLAWIFGVATMMQVRRLSGTR
jgi:hypothetical protein